MPQALCSSPPATSLLRVRCPLCARRLCDIEFVATIEIVCHRCGVVVYLTPKKPTPASEPGSRAGGVNGSIGRVRMR